jgi:hypothetical protein
VALAAYQEPLVWFHQARPEKALQSLTEPYRAICGKLDKKNSKAVSFVSRQA